MKQTLGISLMAMASITIITVAALLTGHDSAIVSAAMATVAGLAGGFGAYGAAKSKHKYWRD